MNVEGALKVVVVREEVILKDIVVVGLSCMLVSVVKLIDCEIVRTVS